MKHPRKPPEMVWPYWPHEASPREQMEYLKRLDAALVPRAGGKGYDLTRDPGEIALEVEELLRGKDNGKRLSDKPKADRRVLS